MSSDNIFFCPELREAFDRAGLPYPEMEPNPGKITRFSTNDRPRDKAGWVRVFDDGAGAVFGDWRTGSRYIWQRRDQNAAPLTPLELEALRAQAERARQQMELARAEAYAQAAAAATRSWDRTTPPDRMHPYVFKKGITPYGARQTCNEQLAVPVRDGDGGLQSLQYIGPDGGKRFLTGGKMKGGQLILGTIVDGRDIILGEGWATGCSIHEATGMPVVVCFSGSNMAEVASDLRRRYLHSHLTIAGDLDAHGQGVRYAEAAAMVGAPASIVFPSFASGQTVGDFNDLHSSEGIAAVTAQFADIQARSQPQDVMAGAASTNHHAFRPPTEDAPGDLLSIPGKLGEMVQWINDTAVKPQPHFAVAAALAFGSVVLGRIYRTNQGNHSSIYILLLGLSACGKEYPKAAIEQALRACGLSELIGPGEYTSDSAVDSALIQRPVHICLMDEAGMILEAGKAKNNFMAGAARRRLMEAFGRLNGTLWPKGYSTVGLNSQQHEALKQRYVENPALTLFGLSTPDTFYNAVGSGALKDGYLNRFIIIETPTGRQASQRRQPKPFPDSVTEWARRARRLDQELLVRSRFEVPHNQVPDFIEVPFDEDAAQLFDEFELTCIAKQDELDKFGVGEMYGRVREIAMRLALIVSQSDDKPSISKAHAQWAIDYVSYWADKSIKSLITKIADSPFAALCNEVAALVQAAADKGLTHAELSRKSARYKASDMVMRSRVFEVLAADQNMGWVEVKPASGRGRHRYAFAVLPELSDAD